jgi:hypothetical protein
LAPVCFIDNDRAKLGHAIGTIAIHRLDCVDVRGACVIVASHQFKDISRQLSDHGLDVDRDFVVWRKLYSRAEQDEAQAVLRQSLRRDAMPGAPHAST